MTLARLSLALFVCAVAEQPHHVEHHAMTVDAEGDVSNEKMKHLMLGIWGNGFFWSNYQLSAVHAVYIYIYIYNAISISILL